MPWTRLDDTFYGNPKIRGLSHEAFRLYVVSLNWSVAQLLDGHVKTGALSLCLPDSASKKRVQAAEELVGAGLWDLNGNGWEIHDFLEYQETRETIEDRRHRWAESKRKQRSVPESKATVVEKSARSPSGHVSKSPPFPSHPIPNTEPKGSAERDDLFKAFFEFWTGRKYAPGLKMPEMERGRINKAVKEALEAGITASEVRARGKVYREKWRDLERSPQALLSSWSLFDRSKTESVLPDCAICENRRLVGVTSEGEVVSVELEHVQVRQCSCVRAQ